jgi:hypothetical protein
MIMFLSLLGRFLTAVTPAGALTPVDSVPYPASLRAETAAWLMPVEGRLRLFVNRAGRDTAQLDVVPGASLAELPAVPLVAGGVAACGATVVVAGFDPRANHPAVVVLGKDGKIARRVDLAPAAMPALGPLPGCAPRPVVLWQERPKQIEVAEIGSGALTKRQTIPVGDSTIEVASFHGALHAAWAEPNGIRGFVLGAAGMRSFQVTATGAQAIAIGECAKAAACVAWTDSRAGYLVRLNAALKPSKPEELALGEAVGGRPTVVGAPRPLVWVSRMKVEEGEPAQWFSVATGPGTAPSRVDGLMHSVTWFRDRLWTVGSDGLHVFRRATAP